MLALFIPIIEDRIKNIIKGVANEFKLDATKVDTMLKLVYQREHPINGQLEVFTFYNNKTVKRFPLNHIQDNLMAKAESTIKQIFIRDAAIFKVEVARVNYVFRIENTGDLFVWPNIGGEYKERMTLNQIL